MRGVEKSYKTKKGLHKVLDNISYDFEPGVNVGVLGRNGEGKSTLIDIIGGARLPDRGKVVRQGKISWPIGFSGGFSAALTGRDNLRFICRLYREDLRKTADFVEDFAGLGPYFDMPVATYSSGMKAKLTFGITMAFEFDYYLIDELTGVGDAVFRKKSDAFFQERKKTATLIVVSHSMGTIQKLCDKFLVLHQGKLKNFSSNADATKYYEEQCCGIFK